MTIPSVTPAHRCVLFVLSCNTTLGVAFALSAWAPNHPVGPLMLLVTSPVLIVAALAALLESARLTVAWASTGLLRPSDRLRIAGAVALSAVTGVTGVGFLATIWGGALAVL